MTDRAFIAELSWVVALAAAAGGDQQRLRVFAESAVGLTLDRMDPRRRRSLERAGRIARAHAAGVEVPELCERFRLSKSQVYRLLELSQDFMRQIGGEIEPSQPPSANHAH